MLATSSRLTRAVHRARDIWAELDYAQRRLFELQTGVPVATRRAERRRRSDLEQLEVLYRLSARPAPPTEREPEASLFR